MASFISQRRAGRLVHEDCIWTQKPVERQADAKVVELASPESAAARVRLRPVDQEANPGIDQEGIRHRLHRAECRANPEDARLFSAAPGLQCHAARRGAPPE